MTSTIRYLLDENISRAVKSQLLFHAPDIDVICIGNSNAPAYGTPDGDLLEWIEQTGYINGAKFPVYLPKLTGSVFGNLGMVQKYGKLP